MQFKNFSSGVTLSMLLGLSINGAYATEFGCGLISISCTPLTREQAKAECPNTPQSKSLCRITEHAPGDWVLYPPNTPISSNFNNVEARAVTQNLACSTLDASPGGTGYTLSTQNNTSSYAIYNQSARYSMCVYTVTSQPNYIAFLASKSGSNWHPLANDYRQHWAHGNQGVYGCGNAQGDCVFTDN